MKSRYLDRALLVVAMLGAAGFIQDETARLGRQEYTEVHMGMPVRITLYASIERGQPAARAAFDRIAALDGRMSDYRPDSEVRRLQERRGNWTAVSEELFDVLARCSDIAAASGGAFDPTIGPVVEVWRRARQTGRLPDPMELELARLRVGWHLVELDARRRAVRLSKAGMQLDLGGIAKGYILQEGLATLRANGVHRALIVAGGDIVAGDAPPDARGWRIDVPGGSAEFAERASALTHAALATSGPGAQFVVIDGTRYSHVVDPRTGIAVTNDVVAHVIAPDGATADALATALSVLGLEGGRQLLARFPGLLVSLRSD